MDIAMLARREKRAETNRRTAERSWRLAWWHTTMALGNIDDKEELSKAVSVMTKVTGQSTGWVRSRANTGKALREAGHLVVTDLPPRMSIELVSRKVELTNKVIEGLKKAEESGMSLREYSASLTGKAWSDTAEGASEEKIKQIIASQPELVGRMVAQHEDASQAHDSEVLSHHQRGEGYVRPADWSSPQHVLTRFTLAVKELRKECDKAGDLSENARSTIDWALAELSAIKEGRDFVGEIESWLEGNTV